MIWHNDEPLNFPNSVLIYALSALAKRRVTVVLTGEGADELFGGYPRYHIPKLVARLQNLPRWVQRAFGIGIGAMGGHRLRKLLTHLNRPMNDVLLYNAAIHDSAHQRELWPGVGPRMFRYRTGILQQFAKDERWLHSMSLLDQHTYLVSILNRQDKMSMAASVESRVPLLDYRLVEFANSLPDHHRLRGRQTKLILKRVAERYLPREIIYRRKSGFGIPVAEWFRGNNGLALLAQSTLSDVKLTELEDRVDVASMLGEHRSGRADHGEFLWSALNFVLWKKMFRIN